MRWLFLLAGFSAAPALAQSNEWSLNLFIVGPKHYAFERGATAKNEGGAGIGLSLTRNLNPYLAVGVEAALSEFEYRAGVAPGSGNAAGGFQAEGNMETGSLRAQVTWNLLARPLTPFVTANAGAIVLDTNLDGLPPANACWIYPWYGEVCGDKPPKTTLTRLTYGVGAGMRYDLPRDQGFIRAFVAAEWIDVREALSPVGYVVFRTDWGLRF